MDSLDQSLDSLIASKQKERHVGGGRGGGKFVRNQNRNHVNGLSSNQPVEKQRTHPAATSGGGGIQSRLGGVKTGVTKATDRLGRRGLNTDRRGGRGLSSIAGGLQSMAGSAGIPARSVTITRSMRGGAGGTIFPTAATLPIVYTEQAGGDMIYPGIENEAASSYNIVQPMEGGPRRHRHRSRGNVDEAWSHDMYHTLDASNATAPRTQTSGSLLGLSQAQLDGPTEVRLKNFHWEASQEDIKTLLADFEPIKRCDIIYDTAGRSKGEARIVFNTRKQALEAHKRFHGQILDDLELSVEVIEPVPSRGQRAPFSVHAAAYQAAAGASARSRPVSGKMYSDQVMG